MTWALILGMALITYANRYLFFARSIAYRPGARIQRLLSYSSYAVLTAIWAPIVFEVHGSYDVSLAGLDYAVATSLAAILSFSRINSLIVVLASTAVFFLIRFF